MPVIEIKPGKFQQSIYGCSKNATGSEWHAVITSTAPFEDPNLLNNLVNTADTISRLNAVSQVRANDDNSGPIENP
jgi:hypothetical protein